MNDPQEKPPKAASKEEALQLLKNNAEKMKRQAQLLARRYKENLKR